jgi:hypothetical protein
MSGAGIYVRCLLHKYFTIPGMTTHREFAGQIDTGLIMYQYPYFLPEF